MYSLITREIIAPLATRIGTALAGYLAGYVGGDVSNHIGLAVAGLILVGFDLLLASVRRAKIKYEGIREGVEIATGRDADDFGTRRQGTNASDR